MGISIWQLVIVLVIVLLLFGTKKLRSIGSDLGSAIKSFRSSVTEGKDEPSPVEPEQLEQAPGGSVIEGEMPKKETDRA